MHPTLEEEKVWEKGQIQIEKTVEAPQPEEEEELQREDAMDSDKGSSQRRKRTKIMSLSND